MSENHIEMIVPTKYDKILMGNVFLDHHKSQPIFKNNGDITNDKIEIGGSNFYSIKTLFK